MLVYQRVTIAKNDTPWKINHWNLQITSFRKEHDLNQTFRLFIFRGVLDVKFNQHFFFVILFYQYIFSWRILGFLTLVNVQTFICRWHPVWGDEPNSYPSCPVSPQRWLFSFVSRIWNIEFARTNRLFGPQCEKWDNQHSGWLPGWVLRVCGNFTKQLVEISFWHFVNFQLIWNHLAKWWCPCWFLQPAFLRLNKTLWDEKSFAAQRTSNRTSPHRIQTYIPENERLEPPKRIMVCI